MYVDDAVVPSLDKADIENAHITGEYYQLDAVPTQRRVGCAGEGLTARMRDGMVHDSGAGGAFEPDGIRPIADDERDLRRIGGVGGGIDQRLQIRAAAGNQHADLEPAHYACASCPWC